MSNRATSTNASASARPPRMIIHGRLPERGRWADPRGTLRAALAGRCRGAGAAVEPVGRELRFDRVADGAGCCGSGFDRADGWLGLGQKRERARAGNPGDRQAVRALEPPDRSFGQHAIAAIDRTRRIAGRRQAALQRTHNVVTAGLIARPRAQDEDWLAQRGPRPRTHDAVHLQAVRRLERNHRVSRTRSVESVHVPGRIAPRLEITLHDSHEPGTAGAAVAAP